ncbi:MAG: hypothetical protein GY763_11740 [Gammaproteobacteria bacterium]|nr:hypothetical protein [Gammaproteobacteria bacterium]
MALITRLTRLFQADFHAVLDRIEEPDIQLRQAVREMEFDLQQDEQALALMQHEAVQLSSRIGEAQQKITVFDKELDICLKAKKDDLARDLVRRKLEIEAMLGQTEKQLSAVKTNAEKLRLRVDTHGQQLDSMKQKLVLLVDEQTSVDTQTNPVRNEEIEIALLREKQKRAAS